MGHVTPFVEAEKVSTKPGSLHQYQSVSLRTGREPIAFASGTRAEGTYSWSRTLAGTQFKFYFEFIDSAGQAVRYPSSGWVE